LSTLTLRQSTETDIPLLVANGLDERGIRTPGTYVYMCYEKTKLVGLTSGRADVSLRSVKDTSPRTCYQDYIKSLVAGRWDIYLALMERHAQTGIDTGHTFAMARVPEDGQCTNIAATPVLLGELTTRVGLHWAEDGYDTAKAAVARWKTEPVVLTTLLPQVKKALDALGCKRVWA
jgi:hypothetical protein